MEKNDEMQKGNQISIDGISKNISTLQELETTAKEVGDNVNHLSVKCLLVSILTYFLAIISAVLAYVAQSISFLYVSISLIIGGMCLTLATWKLLYYWSEETRIISLKSSKLIVGSNIIMAKAETAERCLDELGELTKDLQLIGQKAEKILVKNMAGVNYPKDKE